MSSKSFHTFLDKVNWARVLQKSKSEPKGGCSWPSRTNENDKTFNYRIDMGTLKAGLNNILVQPNKEAEDWSVRDLAAKNSHAVVAEAPVDPKNDPDAEKTKEQLAADFEKRRAVRAVGVKRATTFQMEKGSESRSEVEEGSKRKSVGEHER